MKNRLLISVAAAIAKMTFSPAAFASPVCTAQPQSKWMSPAKMKAKIAKMGFKSIKVFQTSGSCYEIYAINKDGRRAEVYFNPVTGAVVQNNID
ncbi:PepSY domain-containing protein [Allopontixanthobacter sediminis]|uniref:PepSY domain-containing protein n=1 Tax=Allopontixanthobacter sediminis TaxID=1689985 RepID=A0A845B8J5_9SPHN|nr:PepSY domain-containing protein [Allopontixanthobacter sediminis]MXP45747.1 PepSY domain-containing protein [Allopontixanthobacter sediminis]